MKNAKKKTSGLMIFSICLLIVAIATPVTLALFSDRKESTTQITFGKIEIDEGKTSVSVALDKLLPGDNVFEDKVIVAKDVFSESYILRVKYTFTAADENLAAYLDILSGAPFATVNGYGDINYVDENLYVVKDGAYVALYVAEGDPVEYREATKEDLAAQTQPTYYVSDGQGGYTAETGTPVRQPKMANGLVVKTQAVNASGEIYVSEYNAVTNEYTLGQTAIGQVSDGYAKNYRWFYRTEDGYFYLCKWFDDDTTAENVRIRNVERSAATKVDSITVDGTPYDLTTKAGRDNLVKYYNETYQPSFTLKTVDADYAIVDGAANGQTLAELEAAAYDNTDNGSTSAYEAYQAAVTAFNTSKANYNTKYNAYATAKSAYTAAYTAFVNEWNAISGTATTEQAAVKTAADAYHANVMAQLNNDNHASATEAVDAATLTAAIGNITDGTFKTAAGDLATKAEEARQAKVLVDNTDMNAKKTAVDQKLIEYKVAVMNFQAGRDAVAVQMKDLQELYVFALDGEYNKIPLELTQIVKYVVATPEDIAAGNYVTEDGENYKTDALGRKVVEQTNLQYDKTITLTMSFEAVQSANLRKTGDDVDLNLDETSIADLVEFFPTNA